MVRDASRCNQFQHVHVFNAECKEILVLLSVLYKLKIPKTLEKDPKICQYYSE